MAINALQSSSSALSALNVALDVTANNLANVNTPGFKSSRTNFQDLLYVEKAQPGVLNANQDQRPTGLYVGLGVKVSGTQVSVEPERGNGGRAYTRAGNFALNSDGEIVLANDQGRRLQPTIAIPPEAMEVAITDDGRVFYTVAGSPEPTEAGQIQLASFANNAGLKQIGENLFVETAASGPPVVGNPGVDARGTLRSNFLESSNVDPTRELIELIRTQRAFEMNSQTIRAADDTLRSVAQLRR
jgi:flagellar basal-body rod protein FlgG